MFALGDLLDDSLAAQAIDNAQNDPLLQQLHALAQVIASERDAIAGLVNAMANADTDADTVSDELAAETTLMAQTVAQMNVVAAQRSQVNPYALSDFDQLILAVGNTVNAIPNSILSVTNSITDTLAAALQNLENQLGQLLKNAGTNLLVAALPFAAIVALVIYGVSQAEKTHTGKALVRYV